MRRIRVTIAAAHFLRMGWILRVAPPGWTAGGAAGTGVTSLGAGGRYR